MNISREPIGPNQDEFDALGTDLLWRIGLILGALEQIGMPLMGPDADAKNLLALQLMSAVVPMALGEGPEGARKNIEQLIAIAEQLPMEKIRKLMGQEQLPMPKESQK